MFQKINSNIYLTLQRDGLQNILVMDRIKISYCIEQPNRHENMLAHSNSQTIPLIGISKGYYVY
ncbi:hypothetical protein DP804_23220 [Salmonella enterica subsp. enterica]|nr:hypothetical protein [Salmonella enterica subsp. enterica serovar Virchow]